MAQSGNRAGYWAGIGLTLISVSVLAEPPLPDSGQSADTAVFDHQIRPLLSQYCVTCHSGDKPKGKLRLDSLSSEFSDAASRKHWIAVNKRLEAGEMPPKDKPRPQEKEIRVLTNWITERLAAADRGAQSRVVLRRLNRVEYENTLCDLLGITINVKEQLPADASADGFDNAGAAHHTSSFLMEKYLEVADTALNLAIANRPQPPSSKKRHSLNESHTVQLATENVYRKLAEGEVVCFCSSEWHNVSLTPFYPPDAGNYRFRISASGLQSSSKPVTFRVTITGTNLSGKSGLVGYFDAPPDKPTVFEFVRYMEPRTTIAVLPYGLARSDTVSMTGAEKWDGPGLAIQFMEVEGPLHDSWPPESHRRVFGVLAQKPAPTNNYPDRVEVASDEPLVDAEKVLTNFVRRAFRREVTAEDVRPYVAIVDAKLKDGYTFELAMRAALKGVLISPEFLFLNERPGTLDDFALACRLSYFLWSTMPDDELFACAEQKTLHQPEILRLQVERLLASPKAASFTENFVGQWLGLREIDATDPSHILYPEFDHLLKVSMIRETELFFSEVLKDDLSLTNFVSCDFTMLNGRLAKHYSVPGPEGWEFQRTTLPGDSHRGGLLTMASVLKVTANGTSTSPVIRGAWVLDRILGTPPAPPPDDVPAIDPDIRGATTIREQLAKHRSVESCGACHRKIDPPGFALESFDCIGGWRDYYRSTGNGDTVTIDTRRMPYLKGKKVDPSDVTPDGEPFEDIDQFKQLLLKNKTQLARALTTKLIAYATGRSPQPSDKDAVEEIVTKIAAKDYGLRTLVHEIVQSEIFRNK